ncbi:MAG: proline--tRNA ligase, partial [Chloroflexi bacterium]|nr:proline--tRNA ligase [Chloroflexota bacterium]
MATPDATSIAGLAAYLSLPPESTLKVVFYTSSQRVICVALRGDRLLDERKLARAIGGASYHPSTADELRGVGAVAGYASPVGLQGADVWADPSAMAATDL